MKKILILEKINERFANMMNANGFICEESFSLNRKEIMNAIKDVHGVIVRSKVAIDKEIIDVAKQLEFIGRTGSGMEHIDIPYAQSKGIACFNSPEGNREEVAEYTVGAMLTLTRNLLIATDEMISGHWKRIENTSHSFGDLKIGLVGFGNTGSEVARRLKPFGNRIYVYDKFKKVSDQEVHQVDSYEALLKHVDVVSYHVPLTNDTANMLDASTIQKFDSAKYIVNASRGGVVDLPAVAEGLKSGIIHGVALDVFSQEPLHSLTEQNEIAFQKIAQFKNVILTPHIAGVSHQSLQKIALVLSEKILKYYDV